MHRAIAFVAVESVDRGARGWGAWMVGRNEWEGAT